LNKPSEQAFGVCPCHIAGHVVSLWQQVSWKKLAVVEKSDRSLHEPHFKKDIGLV
jgi:hypothetical protein